MSPILKGQELADYLAGVGGTDAHVTHLLNFSLRLCVESDGRLLLVEPLVGMLSKVDPPRTPKARLLAPLLAKTRRPKDKRKRRPPTRGRRGR